MNNFESPSLKVLWVDDIPDMELKKRFEQNGLKVTIATNIEDGLEQLKKHQKEWDFILIDGRGTNTKVAQNKVTGAQAMLSEIKSIKAGGRDIPHCIYTAYIKEEGDKAELYAIEDGVPIIPKGGARSIKSLPPIIGYIKKQASLQYETQIKSLYSDVFEAAGVLGLDENDINVITNGLLSLSFSKFREICPKPNDFRIVIENVCIILSNSGLIPRECWKLDSINLTDCITYLKGDRTRNISGEKDSLGVFDSGGPILGVFLGEVMDKVLNYTQMGSHGRKKVTMPDHKDVNQDLAFYISTTPNPLFIYSLIFILCDFLKVIASHLRNNPNQDDNQHRCYHLENDFDPKTGPYRTAKVVSEDGEYFHIGNFVEVKQNKDKKTQQPQLYNGCVISFSDSNIELNKKFDKARFYLSQYRVVG